MRRTVGLGFKAGAATGALLGAALLAILLLQACTAPGQGVATLASSAEASQSVVPAPVARWSITALRSTQDGFHVALVDPATGQVATINGPGEPLLVTQRTTRETWMLSTVDFPGATGQGTAYAELSQAGAAIEVSRTAWPTPDLERNNLSDGLFAGSSPVLWRTTAIGENGFPARAQVSVVASGVAPTGPITLTASAKGAAVACVFAPDGSLGLAWDTYDTELAGSESEPAHLRLVDFRTGTVAPVPVPATGVVQAFWAPDSSRVVLWVYYRGKDSVVLLERRGSRLHQASRVSLDAGYRAGWENPSAFWYLTLDGRLKSYSMTNGVISPGPILGPPRNSRLVAASVCATGGLVAAVTSRGQLVTNSTSGAASTWKVVGDGYDSSPNAQSFLSWSLASWARE
jgi:hypothetical protein